MEEKNKDGLTEKEFLNTYTPEDYDRPSNTADMLLFTVADEANKDKRIDARKELRILLVKRKDHPFIHKWALPGGFINIDESIKDAATRELMEETGLKNIYMEQLYTYGEVKRDPRMRVITIAHMALIPMDRVHPIAGDDAEDVAWFSVKREQNIIKIKNEDLGLSFSYRIETNYIKNGIISMPENKITSLSEDGLAFDHIYMINDGLTRLKNEVMYKPVIFNLLPAQFTLNDAQSIYEVILEKSLTKPNFRKWISKYVSETSCFQSAVGHRPAKLYKYNDKKWRK